MTAAVAARVQAFAEAVRRVGGEVHSADDLAAAARIVDGLLRDRGLRCVGFSDAADVGALRAQLQVPHEVAASTREALLACDAGVTSAQWGIAETGTLVLDAQAERHRLLSLVPPVHVALLRTDRILATLDDALAALRDPTTGLPSPAVTFITGPSRTADIELTLVVGVHGPRELHVVIVDPVVTAGGPIRPPTA